jgi:hypothetical protein
MANASLLIVRMIQGHSPPVRPTANTLQENTPAILLLYTQDLKSFVSRLTERLKRQQNPGPNNAKCRMHDGHSCKLHETENQQIL